MWGATSCPRASRPWLCYFNPRPPCGGRPEGTSTIWGTRANFNPRPPCGGRLARLLSGARLLEFQSTPPVWGATRHTQELVVGVEISIHAPRVGGDRHLLQQGLVLLAISIHAPRVGGDDFGCNAGYDALISIHAPRVGGDSASGSSWKHRKISIHAPRVGGDTTS